MITVNRKRMLVAAAVLFLVPSLTWGSGFALFEVGGRSGGMAGTMVAVGDDLSTLFWNPSISFYPIRRTSPAMSSPP